jgi:hypothetical protein
MTRPAIRPARQTARWPAIVVAVTLLAACGSEPASPSSVASPVTPTGQPTVGPAPTATSQATAAPPPTADSMGLRRVPTFAAYQWVPLLGDDKPYPGTATPTSMGDVLVVGWSAWVRDDRALVSMLERQGFAVQAGTNGFFHQVYDSIHYDNQPIYVTTDALYHTWHLVFDKVLRDTEQQSLLPALTHLLTRAVPAARAQQQALAGTPLGDAAERATAYYEAAAVLAGLDLGTTSGRADREIALARAAAGVAASPVSGVVECQFPEKFDGCVDYSLFLPRGHYDRTPALRRYFAAMSVLGQEWFGLGRANDAVLPGLLVTRILAADPSLLADWTSIYEPTAFLVGLADDVTPLEVAAAADARVPGWRENPSALSGLDTQALARAILAAHPTRIDPERAGIRLMGARFTLDAYLLDQLAWPNVGTTDNRRVDVSALDVAAALGSDLARSTQLDAGEGAYEGYATQLAKMTDLVAARTPSDWAGTVYDAWLAALEPQLAPRGAAYPDYMRTPAWSAKSLQSALGSYAELKHDTILYAKQGTAGEGGGIDTLTWTPRNWVEPDPVAFLRLAAAGSLLRDGMAQRNLLPAADRDTLDTFVELATWLGGVATRELAGRVVNDTENSRLQGIGSELEYLWFATSDLSDVQGYPGVGEGSDALVADVFRSSFAYLEEATGFVDTLWVIVPIADGRFELARGAVYSYHEFRWPAGSPRLTDSEWRSMLDATVGETPVAPIARPSWQAPFLLGAPIASIPVPNAAPR